MKTLVQSHAAYRLLYHVVWIPKYRMQILKGGVDKYCEKVIKTKTMERYPDVQIEEINIQEDHVYVLLIIPPKYAISKVLGDMKRDSSRELRKKFEYLKRGRDAMWSIGYFVSSVGLDEEKVKRYVKYQEKEDKGQRLAVWDDEATGRAERHP